jgi:hypothetical protein
MDRKLPIISCYGTKMMEKWGASNHESEPRARNYWWTFQTASSTFHDYKWPSGISTSARGYRPLAPGRVNVCWEPINSGTCGWAYLRMYSIVFNIFDFIQFYSFDYYNIYNVFHTSFNFLNTPWSLSELVRNNFSHA